MSEQVYEVANLSVAFPQAGTLRRVVEGVSLTLTPGRVIALVGESGSGKSVVARSLLGLAGQNAQVQADRLELNGRSVAGLTEGEWRALRGRDIGFVPQDALVSLDPLRPIGREVAEALEAHDAGSKSEHRERVISALARSGMPNPEVRALQRSGALSGGLRQRALIASAIVMDPPFLIADEPTTALDPTVQMQILRLLEELRSQGKGILLISHDLGFVSQMADEILVMHKGVVVEQGTAHRIVDRPGHAYTRSLMDLHGSQRARSFAVAAQREISKPVLEVRAVSRTFSGSDGTGRKAVDRVSFSLGEGDTLGLIGESGSGKSPLARLLMGFIRPGEGEVLFKGRQWNLPEGPNPHDDGDRGRLREIGMIYQDPLSSFDPRWNVRRILEDARAAASHGATSAASVPDLLDLVRLAPSVADQHPLRMSGGQRQRVAIARALATNPSVLICDEPVSALDVSVQAQVLDLLASVQERLGISLLMISHDMGVIQRTCSRVIVLQEGRVVEEGSVSAIFSRPQQHFTKRMIEAANFMTGDGARGRTGIPAAQARAVSLETS